MEHKNTLDTIYMPSEEVVAREIEGELIIVPIASGIGDMEDELYTLNDTGKSIWKQLDGTRTLRQIAKFLTEEYDASLVDIEKDIIGLVTELAKRKILMIVN
jgi:hypothetical protein